MADQVEGQGHNPPLTHRRFQMTGDLSVMERACVLLCVLLVAVSVIVSVYQSSASVYYMSTFVEEVRNIMQTRPQQPRHCKDLLDHGDSGQGLRQIYPYFMNADAAVTVYCDHTVDGGGWTLLQRRISTTNREDFYRTWAEYQLVFGNITAEFWLGLDLMNVLTSTSLQELRINLADYDHVKRWTKYGVFRVGPANEKYRLAVGRYTGDAGDAMKKSNGFRFTTFDADHDALTGNCAISRKGGWWFKNCGDANPNGYQHEKMNASKDEGIYWTPWRGSRYSLMNTTFFIRPAF